MKNLALALLLAMPMVASAAGMGIYIPFKAGDSSTVSDSPDYGVDRDYDIDYSPSVGLGLAFDSNIGKDKLFNYRLGLEFSKKEVDTIDGYSCSGSYCDFGTNINIVNTFGFGVLRTETVRLWVGPRINIGWTFDSYSNNGSRAEFELGIAPAVGVNVNLGRVVSLAADIDYKFSTGFGAYDSDSIYDGGSYTYTQTGATVRFYVLFRFGETFQAKSTQTPDQGVVDQSL